MLTRTLTKGRKVVKNRASKRYSRLNLRLEPLNTDFSDNTSYLFEASGLPKQGFGKKCNPIVEIHRLGSDGKFFKVYETTVEKKKLNPKWPEFTLTSSKLCNGDQNRTLQLKLYHVEKDTRKYIGKCQTNYNKLLNDPNKSYPIKDTKGKQVGTLTLSNVRVISRQQNSTQSPSASMPTSSPRQKSSGTHSNHSQPKLPQQQQYQAAQQAAMANNAEIEEKMQQDAIRKLQEQKSHRSKGKFLSYLQGGCELSLMVAIDFTGSNGYVSDPKSLHYIYKPYQPSPYQSALRQICGIVAPYDSDQKFPVWGFGAKFPQHEQVAHDFPVNPNGQEVDGVSGIEQAYLTAIQSNAFQLSGPCCYSPILTKAINECVVAHNEVMQDPSADIQYFILLILTNGQCCEQDKQPTKNLLIYASNYNLPLSIIFVGIGDNNFDFLNELDGDFDPIKDDKGQVAKRDIVQFVAMKDFVNKATHELSRYTLREIPIQFVSYVDNNHLAPRSKNQFALKRSASKYFEEDEEDENGAVHTKGDTMFQISQDELALESDEEEEEEEEDTKEDEGASAQQDSDPMANVPVPIGWEKSYTATGRPFYINHRNKTTQWDHPLKSSMSQHRTKQEQTELQKKQAAAYNMQLVNNGFDYNNTKTTKTAIVNQPIQRAATFHQQPQQQQRQSPMMGGITRAATMQYAPAQQVQRSAVYGQQPQQQVVYAQPQQQVAYSAQPQQRVAFDPVTGRQIVLSQGQQVQYGQPQQQRVSYGQPQVQYAQPQQQVVYAQPQQQVVYAQPQQQQRVVYAQPQQQVQY